MSGEPYRERHPMECDCGKIPDRIYVLFADTDREIRICIECSGGRLRHQLRVSNGEAIDACNYSLALRWRTTEEDDEMRLRFREKERRERSFLDRLWSLVGQ